MSTPVVTEIKVHLEPVTRDTFIDGLPRRDGAPRRDRTEPSFLRLGPGRQNSGAAMSMCVPVWAYIAIESPQ
jgi:hypothetical protein